MLIYSRPSKANKTLNLAKIVNFINGIKISFISSIKNIIASYISFGKSIILANLFWLRKKMDLKLVKLGSSTNIKP